MAGRPKGSTNLYPSDKQRERIYAAEQGLVAFHVRDFETLKDANRFVQRFIKRKAWTSRSSIKRIIITSHNRLFAHGNRIGYTGEIDLPTKWALNKLVIAHELAHIMTPPQYGKRAIHSREFAGTYIYMAGKICGKEVRDELIKAFFRNNVDWDINYAN